MYFLLYSIPNNSNNKRDVGYCSTENTTCRFGELWVHLYECEGKVKLKNAHISMMLLLGVFQANIRSVLFAMWRKSAKANRRRDA